VVRTAHRSGGHAGRATTFVAAPHIYNKIGVSTRAAAALWAMQQGVVG
jgi:DNA-binding CsgD family transcriptional regulator